MQYGLNPSLKSWMSVKIHWFWPCEPNRFRTVWQSRSLSHAQNILIRSVQRFPISLSTADCRAFNAWAGAELGRTMFHYWGLSMNKVIIQTNPKSPVIRVHLDLPLEVYDFNWFIDQIDGLPWMSWALMGGLETLTVSGHPIPEKAVVTLHFQAFNLFMMNGFPKWSFSLSINLDAHWKDSFTSLGPSGWSADGTAKSVFGYFLVRDDTTKFDMNLVCFTNVLKNADKKSKPIKVLMDFLVCLVLFFTFFPFEDLAEEQEIMQGVAGGKQT